jgi:hypothetical protein
MPNTIAEYYTDELLDWNNAILFYNAEMIGFENKLAEVIRRNSIAGIAAKVEAHQAMLNKLTDQFFKIQGKIRQQANALKHGNGFIDDATINKEIEMRQLELRSSMQTAEKEYIDVKFNCYEFLTGTLKKK